MSNHSSIIERLVRAKVQLSLLQNFKQDPGISEWLIQHFVRIMIVKFSVVNYSSNVRFLGVE